MHIISTTLIPLFRSTLAHRIILVIGDWMSEGSGNEYESFHFLVSGMKLTQADNDWKLFPSDGYSLVYVTWIGSLRSVLIRQTFTLKKDRHPIYGMKCHLFVVSAERLQSQGHGYWIAQSIRVGACRSRWKHFGTAPWGSLLYCCLVLWLNRGLWSTDLSNPAPSKNPNNLLDKLSFSQFLSQTDYFSARPDQQTLLHLAEAIR